MKKILFALIIILLIKSIPLSAQGTRTVATFRLRAALKDLAELDRRRKDSKADSITILDLNHAYEELKMALAECREAVAQGAIIAENDKQLLRLANKALRKQKVLKWIGWGVAAVATAAYVHQTFKD